MVFENGAENIQAAAYNGARTVVRIKLKLCFRRIPTFVNILHAPPKYDESESRCVDFFSSLYIQNLLN